MSERACAECGAPAPKLCRGCGQVHYCGRECQGKHWPKHRPACRRAQAEAEREGRSLFPKELEAAPGKPRCTICFGRAGPPFPVKRTCLCTGDDAYAHTACLAKAMRHFGGDSADIGTVMNSWGRCQECGGRFGGELGLELAFLGCAEARKHKDLYSELIELEHARRLHFLVHDDYRAAFDLVKPRFKAAMEMLQAASPSVAKYVTHKTMVTVHEDLLAQLDFDDGSNVAQFVMSLDETQVYFTLQPHDGGYGMAVKTQTAQIMALTESPDRALNSLAVSRSRAAIEWATGPVQAKIEMDDKFRAAVLSRLQFTAGRALRKFETLREEGTAMIKESIKTRTALFGPHHPSVVTFDAELSVEDAQRPWPPEDHPLQSPSLPLQREGLRRRYWAARAKP